jgi:hypothetical protein
MATVIKFPAADILYNRFTDTIPFRSVTWAVTNTVSAEVGAAGIPVTLEMVAGPLNSSSLTQELIILRMKRVPMIWLSFIKMNF